MKLISPSSPSPSHTHILGQMILDHGVLLQTRHMFSDAINRGTSCELVPLPLTGILKHLKQDNRPFYSP